MDRDTELRKLWDAYQDAAAEFNAVSAALADALAHAAENNELRQSVVAAETEAREAVVNARELLILTLGQVHRNKLGRSRDIDEN
jgi:hypothetical protein